jgi:hypothetical protein
MPSNRSQRRAFTASQKFWRVTPLFRDPEGGDLREHVETSLIDGDFADCLVIRVPATCSISQARDIEEKLTAETKKNCIVVTKNIEFCRVERVDPKELTHLLKGIERNEPTQEEVRKVAIGGAVASALATARDRGEGT